MSLNNSHEISSRYAWVVRLGGLAGLFIIALTLVVNFALTPPSPAGDADPEEVAVFFSDHSRSMALANGLRNLGLFLIPVWVVGLYSLSARTEDAAAKAWAMMGVVASGALMALGTVNNFIQTAAFVELPVFAEHPELRGLLLSLSYVGFGGASRLVLGAFCAGFSIAGWQSKTLPRWLCIVGLLSAAASVVTAVAIADLLAGGWSGYIDLAVMIPAILIFQVGVSVQMLRRAAG